MIKSGYVVYKSCYADLEYYVEFAKCLKAM